MARSDLSAQEQRHLGELAERHPREAVRRRARIVLLHDQGLLTHQIASQVGLSRSQVRYWKHRWESERMAIFPSGAARLPRAVAPPGAQSETASPGVAAAPPEEAASPLDILRTHGPAVDSPGLSPQDAMAEAGRKVLRFHFARMLHNEAGTRLGQDIEALHDMRVASRRMRAAFDVFAPWFRRKAIRPHVRGLRATGKALGRVRDLDVFMHKAQAYLQTQPPEQRAGLSPLIEVWQARRSRARRRLLAYLDSEEYARFTHAFHDFLHTPQAGAAARQQRVQQAAPVLIYQRMAEVLAYETRLPQASIKELHALRISFKRLRYTVEFFREVLGSQASSVLKTIKRMQDHLGDLNDADVACALLSRFLAEWDARQGDLPLQQRCNPEPLVTYLAVQHAERHRLMSTFPEAWAACFTPEFKRALALSVAAL